MTLPKILITIDWFLPGTRSGGPVRSYANLIEHLKDDFQFYIITRDTDYQSETPYKDVISNSWNTLNATTKVYYMSKSQITRAHLKKVINQTDFDIAYINGMYSWYFSIVPIFLFKKLKKPIIISARGMLNPQAFSVKKRKKKLYLKLTKLIGVYRNVNFHATNSEEASYIKKELGEATMVRVAPNLPRLITNVVTTKTKLNKPVRFVNIARISVEKGTLKMLEALQFLDLPIKLDIYGPIYDKVYWKKCENIIKILPDFIDVSYKGVLESELVPITLKDYDFFVMLSEGENFGHAILEALSSALPVIVSDKTPWRDLSKSKIGWDINTSNITTITHTFRNALAISDDEYSEWSKNALTYAKTFIENPEIVEQNKKLFLNTLKKITR